MEIQDLSYLRTVSPVFEEIEGQGITFTTTYSIAVVDYGFAFAEADAFALGENTYADTFATAFAAETYTQTSYLTKTTFDGAAYATAEAIAQDNDSYSYSKSESTSVLSYKSYKLVAGY